MIATAAHYKLTYAKGKPVALDFTLAGIRELTRAQRQIIEAAFYAGVLEDTFEFSDHVDYPAIFPPPDVPEDEAIEMSEAEEYRLADREHEQRRDERWGGRHGLDYDRWRR